MKLKTLNWLIVGVGLVGLCVFADRMATAQSKRKNVEFNESRVPADSIEQPAVAAPVRPKAVGGFTGQKQSREMDPHSPTRYREVTEEYVDERGQRHAIRRMVPVFAGLNNEFAQKKSQLNQSLQQSVAAYQAAADEAARDVLQEKIETQLSELFDVQQQEREAQLKPMEERVKKLRETLNKRAAMRDNLVQLRLKVLLQDADGMGWGPDEFLTPMHDPNSPQGVYGPYRTPLSPNETAIPFSGDPDPLDPNSNEYKEPIKKPAGNPEPIDWILNSTN